MSKQFATSTAQGRRKWSFIAFALLGAVVVAVTIAGIGSSSQAAPWSETFDGTPSSPQAFHPDGWDIQYHIRDIHRWEEPDSVDAHHGPNCEPPLSTHEVTQWQDSVFRCANHMMTAINGAAGYGLLYVTPDRMVDFSGGEAVVRFDISTFRTNDRDWWDVWITPFEKNIARPFELGQVDLHGPPSEAVQIRLGSESQVCIHVFSNFDSTEYCDHTQRMTEITTASGDVEMARQRETVEIRLTKSEVEVTMPDHGETLAHAPVSLPFDSGVVQFGHHSYTPGKDSDGEGANTWHWDNIEINPSKPFTMIGTDTFMLKGTDDEREVVTLDSPAPANAFLRFAAVSGEAPEVSFDGGPFESANRQPIDPGMNQQEVLAKNYWHPIPEGTRQVKFRLSGTWAGAFNRYVSGIGVWSQQSGGSAPAPAPTNTPTAEPTEADPTAEPTEEPTSEPTNTATPEPADTATPDPTSTPEPTNTPAATNTPDPTATPDDGGEGELDAWVMSASVSDSSLATGEQQTVNVRVRSETTRRALVDVEIYGPDGEKIYQRYWDDRRFQAERSRSFIIRGAIPEDAPRGEYTVKVGIFEPQPAWGQFLAFEDSAAKFQVN